MAEQTSRSERDQPCSATPSVSRALGISYSHSAHPGTALGIKFQKWALGAQSNPSDNHEGFLITSVARRGDRGKLSEFFCDVLHFVTGVTLTVAVDSLLTFHWLLERCAGDDTSLGVPSLLGFGLMPQCCHKRQLSVFMLFLGSGLHSW